MCWITSNTPKVYVAKNDVKVLKIVRVNGLMITPYFFPTKERYGDVNNEEFSIVGDGLFSSDKDLVFNYNHFFNWYCNKAIHSYLPEMITIALCSSLYVIISHISGVHLEDYHLENILFMDCVIPKGTKYAINEKGEVVSEKIKVTGFRKVNL